MLLLSLLTPAPSALCSSARLRLRLVPFARRVPAARCASPHAAHRCVYRFALACSEYAPVTCSRFRHMRLADSRQCVMDHSRRIAHVATPTPTSTVRYPISAKPCSPMDLPKLSNRRSTDWLHSPKVMDFSQSSSHVCC